MQLHTSKKNLEDLKTTAFLKALMRSKGCIPRGVMNQQSLVQASTSQLPGHVDTLQSIECE